MAIAIKEGKNTRHKNVAIPHAIVSQEMGQKPKHPLNPRAKQPLK